MIFRSIAAVTMVRNEADVIHAALTNLYVQGIRLFVVMDNDSTDETMRRIEGFRSEHGDVEMLIVSDFDRNYFQSRKVTALYRMAAHYFSATHVYPFDADEFLRPAGRGASDLASTLAEARLQDHSTWSLRWRTCIRTEDGRIHAAVNPSQWRKVIVRAVPGLVIGEGLHEAHSPRRRFPLGTRMRKERAPFIDNLEVLHLPVRSAAQLRSKISQGAAANEVRRNTGLGHHWMELHKLLHAGSDKGEDAFDAFHAVLQRGREPEMEEFCGRHDLVRERLAYFNDFFLPRIPVAMDESVLSALKR
jgi:hypothetical protein